VFARKQRLARADSMNRVIRKTWWCEGGVGEMGAQPFIQELSFVYPIVGFGLWLTKQKLLAEAEES